MNTENKIKSWEVLTNSITEDWIVKYFELDEEERAYSIDYSWVANDVGGIFEFADMFFNFSDVLECYKHKITKEQLFLWYDWCLSNPFVNISLAKYILSPKERKEQEEKHLAELKDRMELAEKEFNEAMKKYEINL